jgi:hypothetical protein
MLPSFSIVLAYLDPGSGSFIVQILVATLLGSALMIKAFWRQITSKFRRGSAPAADEDPMDRDD